jgi:hypothetical protein
VTSTYKDLIRDFSRGKKDGEDVVQLFFLEEFGIETYNVGELQIGYDIEVIGMAGKGIGIENATFSEDKLLSKFIKKFGRTFEIKRDFTSDKTGNLYWECWSNKRVENPGCQLSCKADTIIYVRKKEFIFLRRDKFLSWFFENIFLNTDLAENWRKKTSRGKTLKMMAARSNPDVRGILLPVEDIKDSVACFYIKKR